MQTPQKPSFEHDCQSCVFTGTAEINGRRLDFYACEAGYNDNKRMVSLLWRYSNEPSEYGSTMAAYATALSPESCLALALYVRWLGADGANSLIRGKFFKAKICVLDLDEPKETED